MNAEIVINLWAVFDGSIGFIHELAGKAYSICGTDQEKLDLLKTLSATDHVTAERYNVPERFTVIFADGSEESGIARLSMISLPAAQLFEDVFKTIENELPPIFDISDDDREVTHQTIPKSPLCVITVLYEDEDGSIRPIISDEDREWFRSQVEFALGSDYSSSDES